MSETLFAVVAGVLFVILGRWMCKSPTKVYPSWVSSKPDSQFFPRFFRAFATAIIFAGAYSAVAGIAGLFLRDTAVIGSGLLAGFASAWFLRPGPGIPGEGQAQ
jgi:hypothetical protein